MHEEVSGAANHLYPRPLLVCGQMFLQRQRSATSNHDAFGAVPPAQHVSPKRCVKP